MPYSFTKKMIVIWSLLALFLSGCTSSEKTISELSDHYKQNHDYKSLVALVPQLNLIMSRSEVENLLGMPIYCPILGKCYYASDKSVLVYCTDNNEISSETCQSFPLILVVSYSLVEKNIESPQDRLADIHIGPVGE